jgi:Chlorophyll A-B binding protein
MGEWTTYIYSARSVTFVFLLFFYSSSLIFNFYFHIQGLFLAVGIVLELELIKLKKELNGPDDLRNFYNMFNEEGFDVPGNYRFDPLSLGKLLCGDNSKRRLLIQTMEIFNGRMSMLACVGYAMQEYFTDSPVIRETPVFFFPLTDSLV